MVRRFAPLAIILGGLIIAFVLLSTGPSIEPRPPEVVAPLVRVIEAEAGPVQMSATTHGTVVPRTESDLVPEVSGRIVAISPSMVSGGFFSAGDMLIQIDPIDYEVALEQARAGLARAKSDLDNAERSYTRQLDLAKKQSTSDSQKDDAENRLAIARATLSEAEALLKRAERDLARTGIVAPYDGRVRTERADVGQFVNRGSSIATIYATDFAEVRLPVNDDVLEFLDAPLTNRESGQMLPVELSAEFAGKRHSWSGKVVRTEGEIDPTTRMINLVARVDDPYQPRDNQAPLSVGLFVEAKIIGETLEDIVVLPRGALQTGGQQVYVVDDENQIRFRDVEVLRIIGEQVYISSGLKGGERVCVSALNNAVEGMTVRYQIGATGQGVTSS